MSISGGIQCYYWFQYLLSSNFALCTQRSSFSIKSQVQVGRMSTIRFRDEVDFMALISYLQKNSHTIDGVQRSRVTILCLFGVFLFVGDRVNKAPAILLRVVGVCRDQTLMLLVIAETILCLDCLRHNPNQFFLGSLSLLQVVDNPMGQ